MPQLQPHALTPHGAAAPHHSLDNPHPRPRPHPAGTMIQKHKLEEADFRGERFKDYHRDLKGDNDLLTLTRVRGARGERRRTTSRAWARAPPARPPAPPLAYPHLHPPPRPLHSRT